MRSTAKVKKSPEPTDEDRVAEGASTPQDADSKPIQVDGRVSRELMLRIARGALRGGIEFLVAKMGAKPLPAGRPLELPSASSGRDVMTADEVAEFLGVDRNTVYD